MRENRVLFVMHCKNPDRREHLYQVISEMKIPLGYEGVAIEIPYSEKGIAGEYNRIIKEDDAKYKFYLSDNVERVDHQMAMRVIDFFRKDSKVGMIGLFGSELPLDGDFTKARKRYGSYEFQNDGKVMAYAAENPIFRQRVHVLDDGLVATCRDIAWDEAVEPHFLMAAQCCRFRRTGFEIYVPMQNTPWLLHHENRCLYGEPVEPVRNAARKHFLATYLDIIQPKVSILIPAYNQPGFFLEALESALSQEYENIEIIVGDDSTNDGVKNAIRPYLEQHGDVIEYYHHGKPLGGDGKNNMNFLLNHCHGAYVNYLLHDDLFYPHKIWRMMEEYIRDLNDEVGFVTSERHTVDKESQVLGKANHWVPRNDKELEGETFGRRTFWAMSNFVGETSTMLFKKEYLQQKDKRNSFAIGKYHGVEDQSMWDISTALELCRRGKKCVYLAGCLEAFRMHDGQNTWRPDIVVTALLDWINFVVLSYVNSSYIHTEEEFQLYCNRWREVHRVNVQRIEHDINGLSSKGRERYDVLKRLLKAVDEGNYEAVNRGAVQYMRGFADIPTKLQRITEE